MSGSAAQLYDEDFVRWTEEQSSALRDAARVDTNLPLDWENLAEEIESLGRSQRHELRSRLAVILEHLIKLEHSPAIDPRAGWMDTISRERLNIEDLLRDSPSLKNQLATIIEQLKPRVTRLAGASLFGYETVRTLLHPSYTEDQVIGDWFPGEDPLPASGEREGPASAGG
ncbi:MAG: DUF29 domain-containing protein [Alphaproteobacteria bacterium]|nr:MAG: DUF29 domain-containing protein [Alphaproteobacteria bacterium]